MPIDDIDLGDLIEGIGELAESTVETLPKIGSELSQAGLFVGELVLEVIGCQVSSNSKEENPTPKEPTQE